LQFNKPRPNLPGLRTGRRENSFRLRLRTITDLTECANSKGRHRAESGPLASVWPTGPQPLIAFQSLSLVADHRNPGAGSFPRVQGGDEGADSGAHAGRLNRTSSGASCRIKREDSSGSQIGLRVSARAAARSIWCSLGQYESWYAPAPSCSRCARGLLGRPSRFPRPQGRPRIYVQIGLTPADRAIGHEPILIVEVASKRRAVGHPIVKAAVEGADGRFRPLMLTSNLESYLGRATGDRNRGGRQQQRKSIGITVFKGNDRLDLLAVLLRRRCSWWCKQIRGMAGGAARSRRASPRGGVIPPTDTSLDRVGHRDG